MAGMQSPEAEGLGRARKTHKHLECMLKIYHSRSLEHGRGETLPEWRKGKRIHLR